jgi:hypothetical protein
MGGLTRRAACGATAVTVNVFGGLKRDGAKPGQA